MKLIVGLGNPGPDYINTRHNAGYIFVDELLKVNLPKSVVVKKTGVFMNQSGESVKKFVDKYGVQLKDLYIIHDDLDIKLGEYKIQFGKGPKDHNGIKSIDQALGTDQYWHIRIGVDNRPLDNRPMGEEYVLQNFSREERNILDGVIKEACGKLAILLNNPILK